MKTIKRIYSFRFDNDLIKKLDKKAQKENRNRTNMIEYLIKKFIDKNAES